MSKTSKRCNRCGIEKDLTQFYFQKLKTRTDRYYPTCKICVSFDRKALAYGLSFEEVRDMYADPKCAICGATKSTGKGNFHLDHCHDTGEVRGLLCHHCNTGLGLFRDDLELLKRAVEYLK